MSLLLLFFLDASSVSRGSPSSMSLWRRPGAFFLSFVLSLVFLLLFFFFFSLSLSHFFFGTLSRRGRKETMLWSVDEFVFSWTFCGVAKFWQKDWLERRALGLLFLAFMAWEIPHEDVKRHNTPLPSVCCLAVSTSQGWQNGLVIEVGRNSGERKRLRSDGNDTDEESQWTLMLVLIIRAYGHFAALQSWRFAAWC